MSLRLQKFGEAAGETVESFSSSESNGNDKPKSFSTKSVTAGQSGSGPQSSSFGEMVRTISAALHGFCLS